MICHYIFPLVKQFFAAQGVGMLSPLHATEMTGQSIAWGGKQTMKGKQLLEIFLRKNHNFFWCDVNLKFDCINYVKIV